MAYGGYKLYSNHVRDSVGRTIKAGSYIQRISSNGEEYLNRTFYATTNKSDSSKYLGLFGQSLANRGKDVYKIGIKAKSDIKVAPTKKAAEVFSEFYKKDPEFKKWMDVTGTSKYNTDKEILTKGYESFNRRLVNHQLPDNDKQARKVLNALKKQGYDAIDDVFDQKHAYKTKAATIIFNTDKTAKDSITKVSKDELAMKWAGESIKKLNKPTILLGSTTVAGIIGTKTVKEDENKRR